MDRNDDDPLPTTEGDTTKPHRTPAGSTIDHRASYVRAFTFAVAFLLPYVFLLWPSDAAEDWVILKAGWEGLDVTDTVRDLARRLDVHGSLEFYSDFPGARPPGFYIFYLPALGTQIGLVFAVAILNAVSVAYLSRGSWWVSAGLFVLLAESLIWVNAAALWGALIAATWNHMDGKWQWGVPLGLAATLRLWPLLPVVFLLMLRKRTGWAALAIFVVFTVAGLLVIPPSQAVGAIEGGTVWMTLPGPNVSLSAFLDRIQIPLVVTVAVGSIVVLFFARRLVPFKGFGLAVLTAIVLSPLGWPSYLAATAPAWKLPTRQETPPIPYAGT